MNTKNDFNAAMMMVADALYGFLESNGPIPLEEAAKELGTSEKFLGQVFSHLEEIAEFVELVNDNGDNYEEPRFKTLKGKGGGLAVAGQVNLSGEDLAARAQPTEEDFVLCGEILGKVFQAYEKNKLERKVVMVDFVTEAARAKVKGKKFSTEGKSFYSALLDKAVGIVPGLSIEREEAERGKRGKSPKNPKIVEWVVFNPNAESTEVVDLPTVQVNGVTTVSHEVVASA